MNLNRRGWFHALCAGALVPTLPPRKKIGCLTLAGHQHHLASTGENLEVFVNGVKLHRCYEADDIKGYALAFCSDAQEHRDWTKQDRAHMVKGEDHACRWRITGHVEFRPKVDA